MILLVCRFCVHSFCFFSKNLKVQILCINFKDVLSYIFLDIFWTREKIFQGMSLYRNTPRLSNAKSITLFLGEMIINFVDLQP